MPVALPFILLCVAFLLIGCLRARPNAESMPSVGALGLQLLRIQAFGLAAAIFIGAFTAREVGVAILLAAQGLAALTLLVHGLNVVLARR